MARPPRFIFGFLSQSNVPYNIKLPWQISGQDGAFAMNYREEDAILDDLKAWAKTNWGDRPYRFRFGLDAVRYLFDPTPLAKGRLKENARDQLVKYFPQLQINSIEILTTEDDSSIGENTIRFKLDASIKRQRKKNVKIDELIGI